MNDILLNTLSLALMIVIGYLLKSYGYVKNGQPKLIMNIIMLVTLPCALIASFAGFEMDTSLYFVIALGFLFNIIVCIYALLASLKEHNDIKAFNILNMPGYNIGCFALPFIQTSLGSFGGIIVSMFDIGNSMVCTGLTYALASEIVGKKEKNRLNNFIKTMLSSVPFDVYMFMLFITITGIKLPDFVFTIAGKLGAGNAFLSMLLIGMLFEAQLEQYQIKHVLHILGTRFAASCCFAALIYFFAPVSEIIKHVLIITLFAPIPIITTIFTERCHADARLAGICASCAIPLSLIIMTGLVFYWV